VAALLLSLAAPARAGDDVAAAQGVIRSQSKPSAVMMPRPRIPMPRRPYRKSSRKPTSSCRWSATAMHRSTATKSFDFGEARIAGGTIAQRVHIVDADGIPWEALYTLDCSPTAA